MILTSILFFATLGAAQIPSLTPGQTTSRTTSQTPGQPPFQSTNQPPDSLPATPITDTERSAILITSTDLDLHLVPAESREEVRATLTLHNTSATPLVRIPLQISGSLRWQAVATATPAGVAPIPFSQSPIATDADHTGYAQEAVLTPASPLAPAATLTITVFYAGPIPQSSARLAVLGTSATVAAQTDWDAILPTTDAASTALRGFGNVLWYPVVAPAALLGDTDKLPALIAHQRALNAASTIRLRLTVDYTGDPPDSAIFNGRLLPLARLPDEDTQVIASTRGIATADFPAAPIGLRAPSLFLTAQHAITSPGQLVTVVTPVPEAAEPYIAAAGSLASLLTSYLGPTPSTPLLLLDHPGQPFEDASFLATRLDPAGRRAILAPALVRPLTQAFFPLSNPAWLAQGLPEFMSLLLTEQTAGREAALAQLAHADILIALAEPVAPAPQQPLATASTDILLHLKSASVLWQLREILGDALFRQSLLAFRHSVALNPALALDQHAFQTSLERTTTQNLSWFFNDWVYRDPGLPDLNVVRVTPRPMPARTGQSAGYLVAVDVANEGDATADVPVIVRSAFLTSTARLRIPPHSSASTRVLFESTPESVTVNDGSVPELRTSTHTTSITPPAP